MALGKRVPNDSDRMKWDRTGEENNSGTGGKRVENEMGLERERRITVALEGRE